jgi:hypothetical protein
VLQKQVQNILFHTLLYIIIGFCAQRYDFTTEGPKKKGKKWRRNRIINAKPPPHPDKDEGGGRLHDGFKLKKGAWPSRVRAPFLAAEENKE